MDAGHPPKILPGTTASSFLKTFCIVSVISSSFLSPLFLPDQVIKAIKAMEEFVLQGIGSEEPYSNPKRKK